MQQEGFVMLPNTLNRVRFLPVSVCNPCQNASVSSFSASAAILTV